MGLLRRKAYARTKTNGQSQNCFSHPDTKFCGLGREKWRKERYERSNNLHCSNPNQYHSIQSHSDLYRLPLHVSLSIDSRLEDMVSFGRLYPSMPMPGGFVHEGKNKGFFRRFRDTHCRVYSKKIGEWEYQKFLHLLHKIENRSCKFNHLGLLTLIAGIPLERKNAYFCSQFCGKMLNESGIHHFHKPFGLLRPADFCDLNGFTLLYEGPLHAFENQKAAVPA